MAEVKKKILLVTPKSFYLFHHFLANEFERKGYEVIIANDEYPENTFGKVLGKLGLKIGMEITRKKISNQFLKDQSYDLILIIKGRGMNIELINDMKLASKLVVGYTFDSIKYHKAPLKWWKAVHKFFTFDIRDSDVYQMPLLELFSSVPESEVEINKRDIDLSVISRNHSQRLSYLHQTLNAISFDKTFIYIFEKDIATFLVNFLRSPLLYLKYWNSIHFKSLDYTIFCDIMRRSSFTLDYAHPNQSGLTMRSFEAASVGTKLITNNPFIFDSPYYTKEHALVYTLAGNKQQFLEDYQRLKTLPFTARKRSICNFTDEIISLLEK